MPVTGAKIYLPPLLVASKVAVWIRYNDGSQGIRVYDNVYDASVEEHYPWHDEEHEHGWLTPVTDGVVQYSLKGSCKASDAHWVQAPDLPELPRGL